MATAILISRCLLGAACRWDGSALAPDSLPPALRRKLEAAGARLIPVCPEVDGGLPVPRPPCEIAPGQDAATVLAGAGRVIDARGRDHGAAYRRGARRALALALEERCRFALLKERSPACGCRQIHDGRFDGGLTPGHGVAAELLRQNGVQVFSEEQLPELLERLRPGPPDQLST